MVALGHITKFIRDNPSLYGRSVRKTILKRARSLASDDAAQTLVSGQVETLLGKEHAQKLFFLMATDREYLRITANAIIKCQRAAKSKGVIDWTDILPGLSEPGDSDCKDCD